MHQQERALQRLSDSHAKEREELQALQAQLRERLQGVSDSCVEEEMGSARSALPADAKETEQEKGVGVQAWQGALEEGQQAALKTVESATKSVERASLLGFEATGKHAVAATSALLSSWNDMSSQVSSDLSSTLGAAGIPRLGQVSRGGAEKRNGDADGKMRDGQRVSVGPLRTSENGAREDPEDDQWV